MAVATALTDLSAWQVIPANTADTSLVGLDMANNPAPVATFGFYEGIIQGQYNIKNHSVSRSGESIEVNVTMSREGTVIAHAHIGGSTYDVAHSDTPALQHQVIFAPVERGVSAEVLLQVGRGDVLTITVPEGGE